jgi:alkaline phosphatase D
MSDLNRRAFLATLSALGISARTQATMAQDSRIAPADIRFQHGVASGDPLQDRVILWTRVTPTAISDVIEGRWIIATDPQLRHPCNSGWFATDIARDFTVKVDADDLDPDTTYYYRFVVNGVGSPVGRTRTLPSMRTNYAKFAYASCSNYPYGYFNAYARIAARNDLNFVLHLGDYIYEYPLGTYSNPLLAGTRDVQPTHEIVTLTDYRLRHALYRTDRDLQEAHRQHPFICVWDDHESTNDSYRDGAENHNPELGEGEWTVRKRAAIRAYNEWMPIRTSSRQDARIFRRFRIGNLADLVMLDTRLYGRDLQAAFKTGQSELLVNDPVIADASRSLLGIEQEQWLYAQLSLSKTRGALWRVLGQQVMMAQLSATFGRTVINPDQWDGYAPTRSRLFDHLASNRIDNNIVLTGDIHSAWFNDLTTNPWDAASYDATTGRGVLGVEFVTPAVSSPGPIPEPNAAAQTAAGLRFVSPHMKYIDLFRRGYGIVDMDRERVQGEVYHVDTIDQRSSVERFAAAFITQPSRNALVPASGASPSRPERDPAPAQLS